MEIGDIIAALLNWGQIFLQFSIITNLLKIRIHWGVTLIASAITTLLLFENLWIRLAFFIGCIIVYYVFAAKMEVKSMLLAVSMHFFLSMIVNNLLELTYFAVNPSNSESENIFRFVGILIYLATLLIIRRCKFHAEFLLRSKTIFIISLTTMVITLVTFTNHAYFLHEVDRLTQILNSVWMLVMHSTVIFIVFVLNKFASEIEKHELHRLHTDTLDKSLDIQRGQMHGHCNIISTLLGLSELKNYDRIDSFLKETASELIFDNTLIAISDKLKDSIPYLYGVLAKSSMQALGKLRFEIDVAATYLKLETVSEAQLSRMVGNLLDNALEAAKQSADKIVKIRISNEMRRKIRIVITNSVDKQVDTSKLCQKGISSKEGHSGFGLYEVRTVVDECERDDLYVEFQISCTDKTFTADLLI